MDTRRERNVNAPENQIDSHQDPTSTLCVVKAVFQDVI